MIHQTLNRIKLFFWFFEQPLHPYLRDFLLKIHLIHHHGRQPFHLGYLAPNKNAEELRQYLLTQKGLKTIFPVGWMTAKL